MMNSLRAHKRFKLLFWALLIALAIPQTAPVRAFPVPPLPEGNLLTNPWFRAFDDATDSALDGWTDAGGANHYWSSSQKASNPATGIVYSGVCGGQPVYCGTAARLSFTPGQSGGVAEPEVDAYLYQVVEADPSKRKLQFFAHWVSHIVEPAEVVIYGGNSADGPWTQVWVPLHAIVSELVVPSARGTEELWTQTGLLETEIVSGYSHYKLEIHARLPDHVSTGFKITGVYFAVEETGLARQPSLPGDEPAASPSAPATASAPVASATITSTEMITATTAFAALPPVTPTPSGGERESNVRPAISEEPIAQTAEPLKLLATALSPSEIELSWSASSNNRRGYKLDRSLDGETNWRPVGLMPSGTTSYVDTGLQTGLTYYYRVRVSSAGDPSGISNVMAATTLALPAPTRLPAGPTAEPVATTRRVQEAEVPPFGAAESGLVGSGQSVPATIPVSSLIISGILLVALTALAVILSLLLLMRRSKL